MSEPTKAVFLSYASQDAEAARRICESLRAGGVEVWFDVDGGLEHGDEWDAKIRRQIKECVLFIPLVSANTQARHEGYFRLEWDLAAERARTIASGVPFILPVVIDDTREPDALVPDRFRTVQWTKLRGGEVPPDVQQRFLKLWSHRTGVLKHEATPGTAPEVRSVLPTAETTRKPGARPYALLAAAIVVVAAGAGWWLLGGRSKPAPPSLPAMAATPPAKSSPTAAPRSEARQLADRAFALSVDKYDSTLDDYTLAETLMQKALVLDGSDGEILARSAQLHLMFRNRGFDYSPERIAKGREQAERAIRLVPDSAEAVYALSQAQSYTGNRAAAGESLERVIAIDPNHARALLSLGSGRISQGKTEEGLAFYARARLQPEWAPLADYYEFIRQFGRREFADADRLVRSSYRAGPSANNAAGIALVHLTWDGDLETAVRELAAIPVALRNAPRIICVTAFVQLNRGKPEEALKALDRLTDEFVQDAWSTGPKASLVGRAHALAGRDTAARLAWESGLAVMEARLKNSAGDASYHHSRGMLLAWLGRSEEALQEARTAQELNRGAVPVWRLSEATIYAALGRADLALPLIEKMLNHPGGMGNWPLTVALLRQDPLWDKIRNEPGFQKLIQEPKTEAKPSLSAAPAAVVDDKSVAVLAFADLSEKKDSEYFSDGISEELITVLGRVPGLTVKASSSSFYFKGRQATAQEMGQKLGAAYLVNGSVGRMGDAVRIRAQLIHAATDKVEWTSPSLTRPAKDVFAVQEEIAGLIAEALALKLGASARATKTIDPEAHRLLLEGRHFWSLRSDEGLARAEELFTKAAALDPLSAQVQEALGDLGAVRALYRGLSGDPFELQIAQGEAAARRALKLDPELSQPLAALGLIALIRTDWAEAERNFKQALDRAPNNATAHDWFADLLHETGRLERALDEYRKAEQLDPLAFYIMSDLGWCLINARRFAEALPVLDRAEAFVPGTVRIGLQRAYALAELGQPEQARVVMGRVLPALVGGETTARAPNAVHLLQRLGQQNEAKQFVQTMLNRLPTEKNYIRGAILLALGRSDEGFAVLETTPVFGGHGRWLFWDPEFDPVRDDPRFQRLLVRLNSAENHKIARETLARMLTEQAAKK